MDGYANGLPFFPSPPGFPQPYVHESPEDERLLSDMRKLAEDMTRPMLSNEGGDFPVPLFSPPDPHQKQTLGSYLAHSFPPPEIPVQTYNANVGTPRRSAAAVFPTTIHSNNQGHPGHFQFPLHLNGFHRGPPGFAPLSPLPAWEVGRDSLEDSNLYSLWTSSLNLTDVISPKDKTPESAVQQQAQAVRPRNQEIPFDVDFERRSVQEALPPFNNHSPGQSNQYNLTGGVNGPAVREQGIATSQTNRIQNLSSWRGGNGMGSLPCIFPKMAASFQAGRQPVDKYAGLMTAAEKRYVRGIQVENTMSFITGDRDYYYHQKKKSGKHFRQFLGFGNAQRHSQGSARNAGRFREADFIKRYKDALGVRSWVGGNAEAPRKTIEATLQAGDTNSEFKSGKEANETIEMYLSLLTSFERIEHTFKGPLPRNHGDFEFVNSHAQTLDSIWEKMQKNTIFIQILSNPRGKILIYKMLVRLDKRRRFVLLGMIFSNFRNLLFPELEPRMVSDIYNLARDMIITGTMQDMLQMGICSIKRHELKTMASTPLGLTILLVILHQAEKIMSNSSKQIQEEITHMWSDSAVNITVALLGQQRQTGLPLPLEIFDKSLQHSTRFLDNEPDLLDLFLLFQVWCKRGIPRVP